MEVEVQHIEYGRNGWLHFLITRFLVFPIKPWGVFNYNKKVAPGTYLGRRLWDKHQLQLNFYLKTDF